MAVVAKTRSGGGNKMKMLLESGATAPRAASASLPGPSGNTFYDNPNRFTTYLHKLADSDDIEVNAFVSDHCYAHPWNWKPPNVYMRPIKKIFFAKNPSSDKLKSEEDVDIESYNDDDPSPPYNLERAPNLMDELKRIANFVRPDENSEWEEAIDKTNWTPVQKEVFSKLVGIFTAERLTRLAKTGHVMEQVYRRISTDIAAKRFRQALALTDWDVRLTQWIHSLMFDYLPQEYLVIYLDILQTLRPKIPQLIDKMIAVQTNINGKATPVKRETLSSLLKRSWDPMNQTLKSNKAKKLPGNPILVIAPSGIGTRASLRQHEWIVQLGALGMVLPINVPLGLTSTENTVTSCIDQLVQKTRKKIQEVSSDCPGRPIILLGYNTGAALACQVAQKEHVTAVICLGFPFNTVDGRRVSPDDTLMDIQCPVMFVIGQNSILVRPDDLIELREKIRAETSLLVVGTADDHLQISNFKKSSEGVTQSMVDRSILEGIGDFVRSILLPPRPLPPMPVALPNLDVRNEKECRRKRNSSSISEESEPNSTNIKKSRPGTPVLSAASSAHGLPSNSTSCPSAGIMPTNMATSRPSANLPPGPKRKLRVVKKKRANSVETVTSSRLTAQQRVNIGHGGISLNIDSLASLAPVGPLPVSSSNIAHSSSEKTRMCLPKSSAAVQKGPKIIQKDNQNGANLKAIPVAATHMKSLASTSGTLADVPETCEITREIMSHFLLNTNDTGTPITSATPLTRSKVSDIWGPAYMNDHLPVSPRSIKMPPHQSVNHHIISHDMSQCSKTYSSYCKNLEMLQNSRNPRNSSGPSQNSLKPIPKIAPATSFRSDGLGNILDTPVILTNDGESIKSIEKAPLSTQDPITCILENTVSQRNPKLRSKDVLISNKQEKYQPPVKSANRQGRPRFPNQNLHHVLLHPRSQDTSKTIRTNLSIQNSIRGTQTTGKYIQIFRSKGNSLPSTSHGDKGEPVILTKNNQKVPAPRIFSGDKNEHSYAQIVPKILGSNEEELLDVEGAIKAYIIEKKVDDLQEVEVITLSHD